MTITFPFQTELSLNLQQLSEKAKSTTEFIQRLKNMSDAVAVSRKLWYFRELLKAIFRLHLRNPVAIAKTS